MSEINFDCPHCQQNLDAPEDMAGWTIECPSCGEKIKIPIPPGVESSAPVPAPDEKATTGIIEDPNADNAQKESTVRIDIPEEYRRPEPSQRIVRIKRLKK